MAASAASALVLGVVAVAVAGQGDSATADALQRLPVERPVVYASKLDPTLRPSRAYASPTAVVNDVVRRTRSTAVVSARIGSAPEDFVPVEDASIPVPEKWAIGKWLYLTVRLPSQDAAALRSVWEGHVIIAAVREEMHAAGMPPLVGVEMLGLLPDGRTLNLGAGIGRGAHGQIFSGDSEARIRSRITQAAPLAGLELKSVSVLTPRQAAPAVVVVAEDAAMVKHFVDRPHELMRTVVGPPGTYEATYLELRDPDGKIVSVRASTYRTGVSETYLRQGLSS